MFGFLTSATATWALWKLYDAWAARAAERLVDVGPAPALDRTALAVALQDLDELETPPAQALRRIADVARSDPGRAPEAISENLRGLTAEQRAAVALALVLAARRAA
jgi:hypothetical protein